MNYVASSTRQNIISFVVLTVEARVTFFGNADTPEFFRRIFSLGCALLMRHTITVM